ncbi:MAG: hypothetical protein ACI4EX_03410 [Lachnospiraceae bacterium]
MINLLPSIYDIDKLCLLDNINIKYGNAKLIGYVKAVLSKLFFREIYVETDKNVSGVVFFKSESSHRADHTKSFSNIYESAGEDKVLITVNKRNKISLIRTTKKIVMLAKNMKLFSSVHRLINILAGIDSLLVADDLISELNKIDFSSVKFGVVYYDVSKYDYLFIQYLKSYGIETATLQHAAFIAPRRVKTSNFEFEGVEFLNSTADYFLAWNPFTKDEAIKSGISKDKIKVLGIPKYAYYKDENDGDLKKGKKIFGVVLNARSFDDLNRQLIKYANAAANKFDCDFVLKYHPQFKDFIYDDLADERYFKGHLPLNTSINDYVKLVDFTILSNSSAFIEFVYLRHKVLRYQAGEYDKFKDVPYFTFKNEKELFPLISNIETEDNDTIADDDDELFKYLCYTNKPEIKYAEFFEKVINGEKL